MHAAYPTAEEIWRDYAAGEHPRDFMVRMGGDCAEACVAAHLDSLPDVYGIVRLHNWRTSFQQPSQLRRSEVRQGMLAYLERHREAWDGPLSLQSPAPRGDAPDAPVDGEMREMAQSALAHAEEVPSIEDTVIAADEQAADQSAHDAPPAPADAPAQPGSTLEI